MAKVKVKAKEVLFDGMQRRDVDEVFYVDGMDKVSKRSMIVLDDHVSDKEAREAAEEEEVSGRKKGPSKLVPERMQAKARPQKAKASKPAAKVEEPKGADEVAGTVD